MSWSKIAPGANRGLPIYNSGRDLASIDAVPWARADLPARYLLRALGLAGLEPLLAFATIPMFVACNNSMRASEVARLNGIIHAMRADKRIER